MQAFWRITLPRLRSGIVVSYSLGVILSLADLTLSTYLAGSYQPLSVIVASAFKTKLSPDLNALQVVMLAVTAVIAALGGIVRRRLRYVRKHRVRDFSHNEVLPRQEEQTSRDKLLIPAGRADKYG